MKSKFTDITAEVNAANFRRIENHRKYYIFNSYEDALEWGIKKQNKGIQWHGKILFWEEDKKKFKSYEPEFDLDELVHYNAIKYYTKEELLEEIQEYINRCNRKHPEEDNTRWWLDEYGKLKYVNI